MYIYIYIYIYVKPLYAWGLSQALNGKCKLVCNILKDLQVLKIQ